MNSQSGSLRLGGLAVLLDSAALFIGVAIAYNVRFSTTGADLIPIVNALPPFAWYVRLGLLFTALVIGLIAASGYYLFPKQDSLLDELLSVARNYVVGFTILLAGLFFYREATFSRVAMALIFVMSGMGLLISRAIGRWMRVRLYRRGKGCRRAALVGSGSQATEMVRRVKEHPEYGLHIVGSIGPMLGVDTGQSQAIRSLGSVENASRAVREHSIDTLVISASASGSNLLPDLARACYGVNVEFLYLPEFEGGVPLPRRIVEWGGMPLWRLKAVPFTGWGGAIKRLFDFGFALSLLIILLPLFLILATLVALSGKGGVLYRQRRVGLDGVVFDCLKFRSMQADAEASTGAVWAKPGDARVTAVGKFLRRWSLDELPQLWNVVRGDMSLVGPRPERPEFVSKFAEQIEGYQERHRVRSGLTGWAQVNGLRGDVPISERTRYDRYYVENWSLAFDLKILIMTIAAVIRGENSY